MPASNGFAVSNSGKTLASRPLGIMSGSKASANHRRVLLKLSGEMLGGRAGSGFERATVDRVCDELKRVVTDGAQVAVVVGGGNFFRGASSFGLPLSRVRADQIGMLCTVMNAIAIEQALQSKSVNAVVQSSVAIPAMVEQYDGASFERYFEKNCVVLFAGGTGNALLTTDTAASLRAIDIGADVLLKATKVDGVYSGAPDDLAKDEKPYDRISYDKVLDDQLEVMDLAAIAICRQYGMPIRVFNAWQDGAVARACAGEDIGTLVSG